MSSKPAAESASRSCGIEMRLREPRLIPRKRTACWATSVTRSVLPDAELVAGGVAERRDPEVPLGIRLGHDPASGRPDLLQPLVEGLDAHLGPQAGFARDGVIGPEVADDVAAAVLECRVLAVAAGRPAEDRLVERRRRVRVRGRDPQVRDPAGAEDGVVAHTGHYRHVPKASK